MNDKQFTDELFRRMYDLGCRKAEIENGTVFFYKNCERISQWLNRVDIRSTCFTEENQQIDIAEYLGIVDWSKVAVDTPILVKDHDGEAWEKRYFAFFEDGNVYTWMSGTTSWTADIAGGATDWKYAKLAEV
ncbi:hypothetical protein [Veillonella sp.]|uniref:hypothetical protein n=1 Tax=Veillonella sp. TaxID=1926307 RepID=UPI002904A394|nr:hypothetical protein [Veillonella sp.]MDU2333062.1 hypothetical protein [Veillonella sp.]MDU2346173.1 hypothetical protein [Veillonella sp.]